MQLELTPVEKCWIYAFEVNDRILYVGQTRDLYREERHRKTKPALAQARFKIIRECSPSDASRLERQVIRACKRLGQATLNRAVGGWYGKKALFGRRVEINGIRFPSINGGARYLGISSSSLKNYAKECEAFSIVCANNGIGREINIKIF